MSGGGAGSVCPNCCAAEKCKNTCAYVIGAISGGGCGCCGCVEEEEEGGETCEGGGGVAKDTSSAGRNENSGSLAVASIRAVLCYSQQ